MKLKLFFLLLAVFATGLGVVLVEGLAPWLLLALAAMGGVGAVLGEWGARRTLLRHRQQVQGELGKGTT